MVHAGAGEVANFVTTRVRRADANGYRLEVSGFNFHLSVFRLSRLCVLLSRVTATSSAPALITKKLCALCALCVRYKRFSVSGFNVQVFRFPFSVSSPVYLVVLSIQVSSGKGNAHIVEVEGNGHTLIFLYPFPELPALVLVHQHQHRPFTHMVHGFIVHTRQHYHVRHFSAPSRQYCHALASVLASLTQYVVQALTIHCPWPMVIRQTQEQMPQASHPAFLPPMQTFVHLRVGIVLLLVVQHICHKIKSKRRMHSIAFPLANAHQPHYRILKQHHNIHKDT